MIFFLRLLTLGFMALSVGCVMQALWAENTWYLVLAFVLVLCGAALGVVATKE